MSATVYDQRVEKGSTSTNPGQGGAGSVASSVYTVDLPVYATLDNQITTYPDQVKQKTSMMYLRMTNQQRKRILMAIKRSDTLLIPLDYAYSLGVKSCTMEHMKEGSMKSLYAALCRIEDGRRKKGQRGAPVKYPLNEILLLYVIGLMFGEYEIVHICHVLLLHQEELEKYIVLTNGIPSHDTMSKAIASVSEASLRSALGGWLKEYMPKSLHYIIDGKGVRAAANKCKGEYTPYILNVCDAFTKLLVMQTSVGRKTNEKGTFSNLFDLLDLEGKMITIDAAAGYQQVINEINDRHGFFMIPFKMGTRTVLERALEAYGLKLEAFIERKDSDALKVYVEGPVKSHGRLETRIYCLFDAAGAFLDPAYSCVKSIVLVKREVETTVHYSKPLKDGRTESKRRSEQYVFYLSNKSVDEMTAEEAAEFIRGHWTIENSLHWVLDNGTMHEDRTRSRKGDSIANLSFLRKVALNLIRIYSGVNPTHSIKWYMDELRANMPLMISLLMDDITPYCEKFAV